MSGAINFHGVATNLRVTLSVGVLAGETTFVLTGTDVSVKLDTDPLLVLPYYLLIDQEQVEVTAINTGAESITVAREANGTTAASHQAGSFLDLDIVAQQILELQSAINTGIGGVLFQMAGGRDGVFRNDAGDLFLVTENAVPDMEFDMAAGTGFVNGLPVNVTTTTQSATLVAPSANPRIDVVEINSLGVMNVVTGNEAGSPTAPSVTAGSLGVAEILMRVGMTTINDTDVAGEGVITDVRGEKVNYQRFL